MSNWQDAFTAYTTGWAFNLSISHDMATLIGCLGSGQSYQQWRSRSGRSTFIPVFRQLERRGLIEHNPMALAALPEGVSLKWVYRLSPAGKAVYELLKLSGVADADGEIEAVA